MIRAIEKGIITDPTKALPLQTRHESEGKALPNFGPRPKPWMRLHQPQPYGFEQGGDRQGRKVALCVGDFCQFVESRTEASPEGHSRYSSPNRSPQKTPNKSPQLSPQRSLSGTPHQLSPQKSLSGTPHHAAPENALRPGERGKAECTIPYRSCCKHERNELSQTVNLYRRSMTGQLFVKLASHSHGRDGRIRLGHSVLALPLSTPRSKCAQIASASIPGSMRSVLTQNHHTAVRRSAGCHAPARPQRFLGRSWQIFRPPPHRPPLPHPQLPHPQLLRQPPLHLLVHRPPPLWQDRLMHTEQVQFVVQSLSRVFCKSGQMLVPTKTTNPAPNLRQAASVRFEDCLDPTVQELFDRHRTSVKHSTTVSAASVS